MQNLNDNKPVIMGRPIDLVPVDKPMLLDLSVGERISYGFYFGTYQGKKLAFAIPKGKVASPRTLAITARNVETKFEVPMVYVLQNCPSYLRQRLIDKGVFFIVSDKFAFLPNLVITERVNLKKKLATRLSPVAQYILLYHLQARSLNGMSIQNLADFIPYSKPSISLGLICLEELGLLSREADGKKKVIKFTAEGQELYKKAQPFMIDPVAQRLYCDDLGSDEHFPECSINALSHFTFLNPDPERMIAMSKETFSRLNKTGALIGKNMFDGNVVIEVWKYPPVTIQGYEGQWVDKLSLAQSLADDQDPRVENEVERLIDGMKWSD